MIKTGGGTFNPQEENIYFAASSPNMMGHIRHVHKHMLLAVNDLRTPDAYARLESLVSEPTNRVLLDSGIYVLSTSHAKKHNISMDVALSLAPSQVDGFDDLFEKYVDVTSKFKDKLWGYIEVDQGGCENKIKTRAKLEEMGLRPIPVYHPFNDGWDYFDYLAERYDRICFGNIVKANAPTRIRLLTTAWERKRNYPDLWIHFLGLTPNQWLNAFPVNSGDSSSWLHPARWPSFPAHCDGLAMSELGIEYRYNTIDEGGDVKADDGAHKAFAFCGYKAHMDMLTWNAHIRGLTDLGYDMYPAQTREISSAT